MRSTLKSSALLLAFAALVGFSTFLAGYHYGTGEYMPWFQSSGYELPPDTTTQTFEQVAAFIEEDDTSEQPYNESFNCVDFSLAVAYRAQWSGLKAQIVKLTYPDPPDHMLLAFPTSDRGLVFYETQTDEEVVPSTGKIYNGRRISGIYILVMDWLPLPDYLAGGNGTWTNS